MIPAQHCAGGTCASTRLVRSYVCRMTWRRIYVDACGCACSACSALSASVRAPSCDERGQLRIEGAS